METYKEGDSYQLTRAIHHPHPLQTQECTREQSLHNASQIQEWKHSGRMLNKSCTTCQCQTTEDQNTQNDNNNRVPIYRQTCNRAKASKDDTTSNTSSCMACRIITSASKLLDTEVCRACQAKWLLTFNSTNRRHQALLQELKAQKDSPEIAATKTS